jgi:hypothetical protein
VPSRRRRTVRLVFTFLADPPTPADWLSAWSTFGTAVVSLLTLIAAIAAAVIAYRGLTTTRRALDDERQARREEIARIDAEQKRLEAAREEAEMAPARLVTVGTGEPMIREVYLLAGVVFVVANDSSEPIRDVTGRMWAWLSGRPGEGAPTEYAGARTLGIPVVRAHQSQPLEFWPVPPARAITGLPLVDGGGPPVLLEPRPVFEVEVEFTDGHDRRWRRSGTTPPVRVAAAPVPSS